jgi:hypothetical protein
MEPRAMENDTSRRATMPGNRFVTPLNWIIRWS